MKGVKSAAAGIVTILSIAAALWGGSAACAQEGPTAADPAAGKVQVTKRDYDTRKLVNAAAAVPQDVYIGRSVWLQRCAYCHDGVGQPSYKTMGPWLGAPTLQSLGEDKVRATIAAGSQRMPGFRYTLKPEQVNGLIAFLKSQTADQKPTALEMADGKTAARPPGNDD